ncbi:MAG: D-lyxose/D-mannose family sugar isomerase [Planctomycetota bacterium]
MLTRREVEEHRQDAARRLAEIGTVLAPEERETIEIVDLGLGSFETEGLALVVYVNTDRYCAKELVLRPGQTCPQHRHPPVGVSPGKMETFRCRAGRVFLYVEGTPTARRQAAPPARSARYYTVFHEIVLEPGQQHTIPSDTWHWFQGGPAGAIVSEFSSPNTDEHDVFVDPRIVRAPVIAED